jgi:hypothetical protein
VEQLAGILDKEVMMVTDIGVERGAAGIHHHGAQQPCLAELAQRIVDSRERYPDRGLHRLAVQLLRGDVPVTWLEQESGSVSLCRVGRKCAARSSSRALVKGRDAVMTLISERSGPGAEP